MSHIITKSLFFASESVGITLGTRTLDYHKVLATIGTSFFLCVNLLELLIAWTLPYHEMSQKIAKLLLSTSEFVGITYHHKFSYVNTWRPQNVDHHRKDAFLCVRICRNYIKCPVKLLLSTSESVRIRFAP